ncbi:MAG: ABC transporter ATP-binding protein [Acidimicrobiia bacterium]|nr:ABC transporter ATP-binding protein [Acidimicrobiia bacterium]
MSDAARPLRPQPVSIDIEDIAVAYDGPPVVDHVSISVEPGEMVALLGPSGCGKTTLLRAIAGLEPITAGRIRLGDRTVSTASSHVAAERRRVGMVFQDWALFPHLSVARNVAYGLPRAERSSPRLTAALSMVGMEGYEDRAPHTLSGGQQQRVALARALAPEPNVLLLDEPFSNLDASLRASIRTEVHRLVTGLGITAVFVTHDQDEAFVLGSRVAVMRDGHIEQWATPTELYSRPVNPWVARFVGEATLLAGQASSGEARTALGGVPLLDTRARGAVQVLLRPEDLALDAGGTAEIDLVEYYGHDTTYDVRLDTGESVRVRLASVPRFSRSDRVTVRFAGDATRAYEVTDAESTDSATATRPASAEG